jgi:hypothetical protein
MRIGGMLCFAALVACGPSTTSSASRATIHADATAPEGGNGNGAEEASFSGPLTSAQDSPVVTSAQEILVSGRGFAPQPAIRSGSAGGTVDGGSMSPDCIGYFPTAPQHVIKLGGPIDILHVLVDSDGNDLTLAIRTPDGVYHCNDDSGDPMNGLNPSVDLYSPTPGSIEVWVGSYSDYSIGAAYRIGVTEQSGYPSDILRH